MNLLSSLFTLDSFMSTLSYHTLTNESSVKSNVSRFIHIRYESTDIAFDIGLIHSCVI